LIYRVVEGAILGAYSQRRFATELAREEARVLCDELMAEEAMALIRHDLIAA